MTETLKYWQDIFDITDWKISLKRILPEQIVYNGEDYFIGISRNYKEKTAVIYHDIDLTEESIVHELLHVACPTRDEHWINETTKKYIGSYFNRSPGV